jgi:hypothetical protein
MESNLSIIEIIVRYYLMIMVVVIAGFSGYWLLGLLALPVFLSAITGFCPVKYLLQPV